MLVGAWVCKLYAKSEAATVALSPPNVTSALTCTSPWSRYRTTKTAEAGTPAPAAKSILKSAMNLEANISSDNEEYGRDGKLVTQETLMHEEAADAEGTTAAAETLVAEGKAALQVLVVEGGAAATVAVEGGAAATVAVALEGGADVVMTDCDAGVRSTPHSRGRRMGGEGGNTVKIASTN
mmetsp:Transcript_12317/g.25860  ORF Transcript_12317/g.25860 Transcript_12317/m.25860 type:complete len:181 (-) Transcript_12317:425-967(-)